MLDHPIIIQGLNGPIFVVKGYMAVIATNDRPSNNEIALAINLLRWGCDGIQFLVENKRIESSQRSEICSQIDQIAKSLAIPNEEFGCHFDEKSPVFCVDMARRKRK